MGESKFYKGIWKGQLSLTIIEFEIKNTGYSYKPGDILTVPVGGATGIPTTPNSVLEEEYIF